MSAVVLIRGAGDLATGTIVRLHRCGVRVLAVESAQPSAIRRAAALSEAIYDGAATVEGVTARRIDAVSQAEAIWVAGEVPLLADETLACLVQVRPAALVDAILAKRNLGTRRDMAPVTVALGPGFTAGQDVDAVIETMRGHDLGRVLYEGQALPNTGVPGLVGGESAKRVIHAPAAGTICHRAAIGDSVEAGQVIAMIGDVPVRSSLTGVLRGLIREGFPVTAGMKIADVDPRGDEKKNCWTISDKARCIAGGVQEALWVLGRQKGLAF